MYFHSATNSGYTKVILNARTMDLCQCGKPKFIQLSAVYPYQGCYTVLEKLNFVC